ncbi:MAG: DUF1080 domain-containing protein [Verrucomicrobia bacterium]|nr:DUF1080 domain-containing protein [Verrucomicrobiota bacterium]
MSREKQCPQCKTVYDADVPLGLCPACLLKHALEPEWLTGEAADLLGKTDLNSPVRGELASCFPELEILEEIGRGGTGTVYKARQKQLDRLVALKVIAPHIAQDPTYIARFRSEATAAARLNHPHVVQIYSAGEAKGLHYLVEEFVEGESLRQRLDRHGRMDPEEALAVCVYLAEALDYAWRETRLIHRDIKPDNILLSTKGVAKLSDLGLAKCVGEGASDLTRSDLTVGTPHYISPEQARGEKGIDFRSDIYSLGCTLYHMLSGQRPYEFAADESPMAVVVRQISEPPPEIARVLPACPMPVVALLNQMLAKRPGDRHQSYGELISELWQAHDAVAQGAGKNVAVRRQPAAPGPGKKWEMAVGGMTAVVAIVALLMWAPWNERELSKTVAPMVQPIQERDSKQKGKPRPSEANPVVPSMPVAPVLPDGFQPLFNGRDLKGWMPMQTTGRKDDVHQPAMDGWSVQNGELICSTDQSGWLKSERQYGDFVLQLEYKLPPDGNSGVHIRCPDSGSLSRVGMEIQIIDEHVISARGYRSRPGQLTGGIYGIAGLSQPPQRPIGEWNSMEIRCEGDNVEVMLNGTRTVSANMNQSPELSNRPRSGYIGLSNYKGEAKGTTFRNIRIKELPAK